MPVVRRVVTTLRWRYAAGTDRGRRRRRNEDAHIVLPASRLCAVADGMGGHAAGDVASRLAIECVTAAFAQPPSSRIGATTLARRLRTVFDSANRAILDHAALHRECAGMGTTLTVAAPLAATEQCVLAHIGDSRAYRLRDGELTQLTRDHTWVQQQVDAGMLTPLQARHHPLSSVLSRVLGTADIADAETFLIDAAPGDIFLLCSDGLTTMIDDLDLRAMLDRALPLEQHVRELIDAANLRGGFDNITAVLLAPELS